MAALRAYLQERVPDTIGAASAASSIDRLLDFFGPGATVASLTPQTTRRYEKQRAEKRIKTGTIRRELSLLSAALNHAIKNGRLLSAPRIVRPPGSPPRTRHLDEDEIARLLDACRPTPHLFLWVMLALNTAARKGALLELTWTQVQLDQGLIYLNPEGRAQTAKGRAIVPISGPLRGALTAAFARRSCPVVGEWNGGRVKEIRKAFRRACTIAGIADACPHTLRHTAATLMAKSGVDLFIIAKILGHSVAKVTEMYLHHKPEWLRAAVEVLGRATLTASPAKPLPGRDGER